MGGGDGNSHSKACGHWDSLDTAGQWVGMLDGLGDLFLGKVIFFGSFFWVPFFFGGAWTLFVSGP
jgi:hypothetical protein